MIQTRDCPECNAEHRLHIKRCGCGYVFASQTETASSYPVAETRAAYDERIKREMAESKTKPAKKFQAPKPSHAWAYRIMERHKSGETVPVIALEFAKQVVEKRIAA